MAVGCYIPLYLSASFRGVPFEALDTESEHGRRGAEGEFPFGEQTAYADLGIRIRTYAIKARFAGNDHIRASDALVAACEAKGPATLLHPTRGAVKVACKSCKVTDNPTEAQGVTYVQLQFVEANDRSLGFSFGGLLGGLPIGGILQTAQNLFGAAYIIEDVLFHRRGNVLGIASEALLFARGLFDEVTASSADEIVWQALREIGISAISETILSDSDGVFNLMSQTLASIDAKVFGEPKIEVMRRMANEMAKTSTLPDAPATAINGLYAMTRLVSAAYMIRGAIESSPPTLDAAFKQHDIIINVLQQEANLALAMNDVDSHVKISEFLVEAQAVLLNRAYTLPAIVEYDFGSGVPSLVATYAIHGDAKRFREIETRNHHQVPYNMGPEIVAVRD